MRGVLPVSPQEEAGNAVGWVRSGQPRERDYGLHTPDRHGEATDFGWRQQPDWSAAGRVSDAVVGPSPRRFSLWNTHQTQVATAAGHTAAKRLRGRRGRRVEVPTWLVSGGGACSVYVVRIGRGSGTPSGSTNDRAPSPKRANPLACARWEGGVRDTEDSLIVTAGRIPIRPHPKPIRIQNSDGWAFLTSVSAP